MVLSEIRELFEKTLFDLPSTPDLFNQYRDADDRVDLPGAAQIRKANFSSYLESFTKKPPVLIIGEAAGPWDCRFSGIPFTGERQLVANLLPFGGRRSSRDDPGIATRKISPYTSISAAAFWKALLPNQHHFFVWNAVPFHPHPPESPLGVRNPGRRESGRFLGTLKELDRILRPKLILAVGRRAQEALTAAGLPAAYVRHPSQGGASQFHEAMRGHFT